MDREKNKMHQFAPSNGKNDIIIEVYPLLTISQWHHAVEVVSYGCLQSILEQSSWS